MRHGIPSRRRRGTAWLWLILSLAAVAFLAIGGAQVWDQDRQIRESRPVPARIVSSEVKTRTTGSGSKRKTQYRPTIQYTYEVDGRTFSGTRVTPLDDVRAAARARALVAQFPAGRACEAYVLPESPARAFLVRHHSDTPYVFCYVGVGILAGLMFAGLGYALVPGARARDTATAAGSVCLRRRRPLRARVWVNLFNGAVTLALTALIAWHYQTRVRGPHDWGMGLLPALLGLGALTFFALSGRAHFTRRVVSDARVLLERPLSAGASCRVRVEQDLNWLGTVDALRVGLRCRRTTKSGKNTRVDTVWEQWESEANPVPLTPSKLPKRAAPVAPDPANAGVLRTILLERMFNVPADKPPSSPPRQSSYPRHRWELIVDTVLPGCPDYREVFEVMVGPAT